MTEQGFFNAVKSAGRGFQRDIFIYKSIYVTDH